MTVTIKNLHEYLLYFYDNKQLHQFAKTGSYNFIYNIFFSLDRLFIFRPILIGLISLYAIYRVGSKWANLVKVSSETIILNDTCYNFNNILNVAAESIFIKKNIGVIRDYGGSSLSPKFIVDILKFSIISAFQCRKFWFKGSIFLYKTLMESTIFYNVFVAFFENHSSKYTITSCDHSPIASAFIFASKKNSKFNIYIQHGLISSLFPPSISDLSIVFDDRSKKFYQRINKSEKTLSMQINPIENFEVLDRAPNLQMVHREVSPRDIESFNSIALVLNLHTSYQLVNNFLNKYKITRSNRVSLIICPHPLTSKYLLGKLSRLGQISNYRAADCELYICGNTSSIIELIACGKTTVYSNCLDNVLDDYYGLVEDKIVNRLQ